MDLRGHNPDGGRDEKASGACLSMVILQGSCFKNGSRKVPNSVKFSKWRRINCKTFY